MSAKSHMEGHAPALCFLSIAFYLEVSPAKFAAIHREKTKERGPIERNERRSTA